MERLSDYTSQLERREFSRTLLALAKAQQAPSQGGAAAHARHLVDAGTWSDTPFVARTVDDFLRQKAAVPGLELGAGPSALTSVARQTFSATVLGRMADAQRLNFTDSMLLGSIMGVGAAWRKQGAAIPVSRVSFANLALPSFNVAGLVVCSNEFIELATSDGTASDTLARLLQDAVRAAHDAVFVGTGAAIAGIQPAGVAANAIDVPSSGDDAAAISDDVTAMIAAMIDGLGTVRNASWILSAEAYSKLATLKILDTSGEKLAGLSIVKDAPSSTFLLVDGASLFYATNDGFAELSASTQSLVEMDSAPVGNVLVPTSATLQKISLFQSHATALKASLPSSWTLDTAHADTSGNPAVIALTGASYA